MQEGSRFGPYQLIKRIAFGGMAEIHLAKTTGIGGFEKLLALKVIHPKFSEDQEFIDMLIDEAKITVQLSHVNIAQVFDLGKIDMTYYIAMEFIDGKDLYQLLVKCAELEIEIPFDVLCFIGMEMAAGLQYAHTKSDNYGRALDIIHRDISPQNVLISCDGEVKLVDFGIAKASQRSKETESGVIKGKFFYMSPEQAWGDSIDARTDIFSAGICLYEMITGEMLYNEDKALVLLDRVRKADIPDMRARRPDLPAGLEAIVYKALSRDRAQRYQSAGALLGALSAFLYSTWPDFNRSRVTAFFKHVFGEQRFVLPMPKEDAAARERRLFMEAQDFDATSGKSVIYDLRNHDLRHEPTPGEAPSTRSGKLPALVLETGESDFGDEDHTMSSESAYEEVEERTIAEMVWAKGQPGGQLLPAGDDDEDSTAIIDMEVVGSARRAAEAKAQAGDASTVVFDRPPERPSPPPPPPRTTAERPAAPPPRPTIAPPRPTLAPLRPEAAVRTPPARGRSLEAARPTLHVDRGRLPARKPSLAKRILSPLGLTLVALLGLAVFAGVVFIPKLLTPPPPPKATLIVASVPEGATLTFDGKEVSGRTPTQVEGLGGGETHQIAVTLKGYDSHQETISVSAEELKVTKEIKRRVLLKKSRGRLVVKSDPAGAEVFMGGMFLGMTPLEQDELDREKDSVLLMIGKDGFKKVREERKWGDETLLEVDVKLTPLSP